MLNLAISCSITSNLPWFMDLTSQFPMQYCSSQHWTLLLPPGTSTHHFCFSHAALFLLELLVIFLHSLPVAYQIHFDLRGSSSGIISLCFFILSTGFSSQEYLSELQFPSPVDSFLSDLFAMTLPFWVALHSMSHSFIELWKPLWHNTVRSKRQGRKWKIYLTECRVPEKRKET